MMMDSIIIINIINNIIINNISWTTVTATPWRRLPSRQPPGWSSWVTVCTTSPTGSLSVRQNYAPAQLRDSIRFEVMGRFANFRIGRACPLLVVVKRLKPLTVFSGTVYRLASSMSDHTPVLFNDVFEDWNEKFVVPHICFDSIRIRFQR